MALGLIQQQQQQIENNYWKAVQIKADRSKRSQTIAKYIDGQLAKFRKSLYDSSPLFLSL